MNHKTRRNFDTIEPDWSLPELEALQSQKNLNAVATNFQTIFATFLNIRQEQLYPFARASEGLTAFLKYNVKKPQTKVLLSAFNCPTVKEAILEAGLSPVYFDYADPYGRIDYDHVIAAIKNETQDEIGAVIIPHLYGVPSDFTPIIEFCRRHNILIIEDCAHTLGGLMNGQIAGTLGDAAIFSFGYDKPLALYGGGYLLLNTESHDLPESSSFQTINIQDEYKRTFWIYKNLAQRRSLIDKPFLSLLFRVLNRFKRKNYSALSFGQLRAALGHKVMERYADTLQKRNNNAEIIRRTFPEFSWYVSYNVEPAWLKQKLVFQTPEIAQSIAVELRAKGFRAGHYNWPHVLTEKDDLSLNKFQNSDMIARCGIDIPIHQNIEDRDMDKIIKIIKEHSNG